MKVRIALDVTQLWQSAVAHVVTPRPYAGFKLHAPIAGSKRYMVEVDVPHPADEHERIETVALEEASGCD